MKTEAVDALSNLKYSKIKTNVSSVERFLMIISVSNLLNIDVSKEKKSIVRMSIGEVLLLCEIYGYYPMYDAINHVKSHKVFNFNF